MDLQLPQLPLPRSEEPPADSHPECYYRQSSRSDRPVKEGKSRRSTTSSAPRDPDAKAEFNDRMGAPIGIKLVNEMAVWPDGSPEARSTIFRRQAKAQSRGCSTSLRMIRRSLNF